MHPRSFFGLVLSNPFSFVYKPFNRFDEQVFPARGFHRWKSLSVDNVILLIKVNVKRVIRLSIMSMMLVDSQLVVSI